ncbi:aldehyde dehydrogenase family protein [Nocardioides sp. zg-DK7169]|uniref:aldehyde dehydrogenase family protein n=1 Tax=Nocardioides sp. zg-DK7169 TaxID=2736600 RepID=UPI001555093C|nr:aldehyde dehydrogenase family protein [Nocardioides sp. zg-DK7169]NPC96041.1 aldehyde dehydrogenase family protein [Nocardioides sp. zg-DK7169]
MTVEKRTASTYISSTWMDGASGESFLSVSPSTEAPLGETVTSSVEQVDEAVAAAKAAFHPSSQWRSWTPQMRADAINRFADILERETEPLSRLIASEVGTPVAACRAMQVGGPIDVLRWYATMALKGPRGGYEQALPHYDKPVASGSLLHYEPVGVVAALPAYNYPLNLLVWKLGGALASGCTTVVLPSPQGLWSTLRIFELLDEAGFPPGVVNLVTGGPEIGIHLTGHRDVDLVSFTGSDAVGAMVMSQGALGSLSKAVLELGGKSPNIVLPSADLPATVGASILRFARNAGQGCAAWSRILVPEERVDEFCRLAEDFIAGVKVGDPMEEDSVVGPVISAAHRDKVEGWIAELMDRGASWGAGGGRPEGLDQGHFMRPGLLRDVHPDDPLADTEFFAPVGMIFGYRDVDHAIELANNTRYGLAGNVFGPLDEAIQVARRIRAGTVTVNGGSGMRPDAPWGGPGRSGVGRELGEDGYAEFFEVKHIQYALAGITRPPGT